MKLTRVPGLKGKDGWRDPYTGEPFLDMAKEGLRCLFDDALAEAYMKMAAQAPNDVEADFWVKSAISKMSGHMKKKYFIR